MNQAEIQNILTHILGSAINGRGADEQIAARLSPDALRAVAALAKKHDLAHVVSDFVYDNGVEAEPELADKLTREGLTAVYRSSRISNALEQISSTLEEAGIAHIPLKGAILREYYPKPSMRTSCDVDVLVREADLEAAALALEKAGYRRDKKGFHDISMYSPTHVHLELHYNLKENRDDLDKVLCRAWDHARPSSGSRYELTKEFFVFHIYTHMAYHFITGGCGIRSLMDVWIMEHKMDAPYTCAEALLREAGVYTFAAQISDIANKCFSDFDIDEFTATVLQYIYSGGVYGSARNKVALRKTRSKSTLSYTMKRIFLPYKTMQIPYPVLKKAPFLLPFCWIARIVKALCKGKSGMIASEMSYASNIPDEKVDTVRHIRERLGL